MENESKMTRTTETETISRAEYEALLQEYNNLKQKIGGLEQEVESLDSMNKWLTEQLESLKKQRFGSKSEKTSEEVNGQTMLFDEPEVYAYIEEVSRKTTVVAAHERVKKEHAFMLDKLPENAEVEIEEHRLNEEERTCPTCGEMMDEIGKDVTRTLKIIPAKIVVHEDHYYTYACKKCADHYTEDTDSFKTEIKKTPHVPSVYPGSNCSASAAAYIMTQKYVMGSPLYRMEADFNRSGYPLSRQTMSNWIIHCSEKWLTPLYKELQKRLLQEEILHADETELQVLHEPGKAATAKSYMWLYRTGRYTKHPTVLYEYCPGRGGEYPKKFLEGYSGYLQTDGYIAYDSLADVKHVGCMAHLKRKFHEAVESLPKGKKSGTAVEGEAYCKLLFDLEETFADMTPEERKNKRQELSKPVLDEFLAWGLTRKAAPKSKLNIALTYLNNQSSKLREYLNDGRLEISNNRAERSIKPFVIDRKGFLFANTPKGANASAVTFSIIETAKENALDPFRYLTYIFSVAPILAAKEDDWISAVLPENAPDECKVSHS